MNHRSIVFCGFGLLLACSVPPQQGAVIQAKLTVNDGFSTRAVPKTTADVDHYTYKLRDNGTNAVIGTFTSGSTSFTFTGVVGGVYKLTAEAFSSTNDTASVTQGGEATSSNTVTVSGAGVSYSSGGALAATLNLLSGNGDTIKGGATFSGNMGDVDHFTYEVVRTSDSQVVYTANSIATALLFNQINSGTYKLRARAYDAGNNPLTLAYDSTNTATIGTSGVSYSSGAQLGVILGTNTWTTNYATMPYGGSYVGYATVDGKIYVMGTNGCSNYLREYNPATNAWTMKANTPTVRQQLAAAAVNGKIYAIGGQCSGFNNTIEEYDTATNTWSTKANMPTARCSLGAAAVNGKIYAIGGFNGSSLTTVEEYNPSTNTWATKANMPTARNGGLAAAEVNGKIYAIGGASAIEEYDPVANTWATKANIPTYRGDLAAAVVNGKIYAIGGYSATYMNQMEEYDPVANTWAIRANMPTARMGMAAGMVNGFIYALGGQKSSGETDLVERYEP